MIFHCSDHSLRMPVTSSPSTKIIRDPALRRDRAKYKESEIRLPTIWSWKYWPLERYNLHIDSEYTQHYFKNLRNITPFYPFSENIYKAATGQKECNWLHVVHSENKESDCTYNWPCGCENPTIEFQEFERVRDITIARLVDPAVHSIYRHVPCLPVFAQGAPQKKKRRRKFSLTDSRSYNRLKRTRKASSANVVQGCSKQLQDPDSD